MLTKQHHRTVKFTGIGTLAGRVVVDSTRVEDK